ncbi:MAG: TraR/DksA family transcriptional regulator [Spirochaetota bacterium]
MDQQTLEKIKGKLLEKKEEILRSKEKEAQEEIGDMESENVIGDIIDEANTAYESLIFNMLDEKEQQKLQEINDALNMIEEGVYGRCVVCGREIEDRRLLAIPEAKKCLKCKMAEEKKRF